MQQFVGEIRLFGGSFAPVNWLVCNGALIPISEYQTLYTLIGTTYGGDGVSTFGLPDLRGRVPMGQGNGVGLTPRIIGQAVGTTAVTLTMAQLPSHNHPFNTTSVAATTQKLAASAALAVPASGVVRYEPASPAPSTFAMDPAAITPSSGGSLPHDNMMPYTAAQYIIAYAGVFPSRP